MKFTTSFAAAVLAISVFAEPIPKQKRALADYQEILETVSNQVEVAGTDLNNYVAGTVAGSVVQASAEELVVVINDAADDVTVLDPLGVIDALNLITPITNLVNEVDALKVTLINAEPDFIADGLNDEVLATLYELKAAGEALRDAITPKVPSGLQSLADQLANQVVADVQEAITAYST